MAHNPGRLSWQEIATPQAGVITIRDAVAAGITRTEIRRRLDDGRWRQPFRGVLITDVSPATGPQHLWAAVQAIGPDAVLAGGCAAALAGLVGHDPQPVTVLVPADRRVSAPPGVLLRHSARLRSSEIDPLRLPRRTTPARSLIDMAEWAASRAVAQDVLADAVRQRIVSVRGLREALSRRGPISRRTLITETLDRLGADAPHLTEIMFRRIERRRELPPAGYRVEGPADEPTSRLSVRYEPWRVRVEVAVEPTAHQPVTQRGPGQDILVRLPAHLLRTAPDDAAELVAGVLRERGWVPPTDRPQQALAS
ncbi:type IV toxin-antitoxin system AbiEi family antitoxin domain-containing protein [Frankia sp. AiPs1]|uniref:type IV toxin-antitoxin system AbiEi family antitoxin domain-containing protein n=1 Tax=Frankia sp. AiPs1 TaxID=573493 RepID=UPI00204485C7|nr:type IV toxin-antitoxin system AbiEi family antitoxin domain-containing protein [Frankia sp. AiPs1]MCM3924273.1 type IV toxin-antitoxin system AbiEi family antitoxin domain-containing protein [Frankia sp. AiPs1]